MTKIEKKLDAATDVMRSLKTFERKAMEELNRLHENAEQNRDDPIEENERSFEVESLMYNGVNLLDWGGLLTKFGPPRKGKNTALLHGKCS